MRTATEEEKAARGSRWPVHSVVLERGRERAMQLPGGADFSCDIL